MRSLPPAPEKKKRPRRKVVQMPHRLTDDDISRQDEVDNGIFNLVLSLAPDGNGEEKIEWDIAWIGRIRDEIQNVVVNQYRCCDEFEFYPYTDEPCAAVQIEDVTQQLDDRRQRRLQLLAYELLDEQERESRIAAANVQLDLDRERARQRRPQ